MKFSESIIRTRKEKVKDVDSINADFLIRGNYIDQVMTGVYTYLPLGVRVLRKIENIVREEMNDLSGQEVLMPVLQPAENWRKTGRWESLDNLYRFTSYFSKTELVLGPTHEEIIMPLVKKYINSYRDLPKYIYQIQDKFRDEKRARSGLIRGREFIMKDLYSFHTDEDDLDKYYEKMKLVYSKIFDRCGIGAKTYLTFASGGSFSKFSHEYQTESISGEDTIYLCEKCRVAINKEVLADQDNCPKCHNKELKEIRAIEVGNIFKNKTKYTAPFEVKYTDREGNEQLVVTGCYGIGIGRLMGTIVEVLHDNKGIIWPEEIAPYQIHLISLGHEDQIISATEEIYQLLNIANFEVLWDDREESTGVKLSDADLLGIPLRLVISPRTIEAGKIEVKQRNEEKVNLISRDNILIEIKKALNAK